MAGYPDAPTNQTVFFADRGSETFKGYGLFDLDLSYNVPVFRSLRPWINGETPKWREDWFYEHYTAAKIIPPSEGVRTTRWTYLRWMKDASKPVEELYDLQKDVLQERNLTADDGHQETLRQLRARWERLRKDLE